MLIDDFDDGNDDGWNHLDLSAGQSWGPGIFDASSGSYRLTTTGIVPSALPTAILGSTWSDSSDTRFSEGSLRAKIRIDNRGTVAGLFMRFSEDIPNGYIFGLSPANQNLFFNVASRGRILRFETFPLPVSPEEDWIIEASTLGNRMRAKAWNAADSPPEDWQLDLTDDSFSEGLIGVTSALEFGLQGAWQNSATFDDIFFTGLQPVALQAGDADQDHDFDQIDLVQVQIAAKYLTGQTATWDDGDWNGAPGGSPGNPPAGDGLFNQFDIIAAQQAGTYLTGPYAAVQAHGTIADGQTPVVHDANTGEVDLDAPAGIELTSVNIDSAAGIFTGEAAQSLGGSFDNDADNNIFNATFGGSFGSASFGNVVQTGLTEQFVLDLDDVTVVGSLAGGGDLGNVDLVYVPEPASVLLLSFGIAIGLACGFRRVNR